MKRILQTVYKSETHLTDTVGLIYHKPGQKASLVQVLQGGDQLVTRTHLGEKKKGCIIVE